MPPSVPLGTEGRLARPPPRSAHGNAESAQVGIDLQADLPPSEPQHGAFLVAQDDGLRADAERTARARRTVDAGHVVGTAAERRAAVKARLRGTEHEPRADT